MKIAIISINLYPRELNFACPIHSFAFQKFLKKNKIDSIIIDYMASYDYDFDFVHPSNYYKEEMNKLLNTKNINKKKYNSIKKQYDDYKNIYGLREVRYNKFKKFTDKYYIKTEQTYNSDLMETTDLDFDCYICATDVIWKTCPVNNWGFERAFFLASHAMDNKYKIAYAASRNSELKESEYELFFHYLKDFDYISVREEKLKEFIEEKSNINTLCVLDPVMLLTRNDYEEIAVLPKESKYVLLYFVVKSAEDTIKQALSYARHNNLKIIEISDKPYSSLERMNVDDVEYSWKYDIGPDEWLGYILNAACIFTNSFHGCCFSILFEKDLFVGDRNGYKVQNILHTFGIAYRQFSEEQDLTLTPLKSIDYKEVSKILNEKRVISKDFIINAIHDSECSKRKIVNYESFRKNIVYEMIFECVPPQQDLTNADELDKIVIIYKVQNNCNYKLINLDISYPGYIIVGWKIKILIDNMWFWYLEDNSFESVGSYNKKTHSRIKVFNVSDKIPYFPFDKITQVMAEAVWDEVLPKKNIESNFILVVLPTEEKSITSMGWREVYNGEVKNATIASYSVWNMKLDKQIKYIQTLMEKDKQNFVIFISETKITKNIPRKLITGLKSMTEPPSAVVLHLIDGIERILCSKNMTLVQLDKYFDDFDMIYTSENTNLMPASYSESILYDNKSIDYHYDGRFSVSDFLSMVENDYLNGFLKQCSKFNSELILRGKSVIKYAYHFSKIGWVEDIENAQPVLTSTQLEAISIQNPYEDCNIIYEVKQQGLGWQKASTSSERSCGIIGKSLPITAVRLKVECLEKTYDIFYRLYIKDCGWTTFAYNNEICGFRNDDTNNIITGIQIILINNTLA